MPPGAVDDSPPILVTAPPLRVLIVEDEPKLASLADQLLAAMGCQTRMLSEAAEVVLTADQWKPDVVLLDLVLRGVPVGRDLTYALRAVTSAPIILMTAQRTGNGVPSGVERLVDDVLWKPFGAGDLIRRVQAAGARHRGGSPASGGLIECGDLLVDDLHRRVSLAGHVLILTSGEYALLRMLAQQADREVPADDLLRTLWGPAFEGDLDYLDAYIARLRQRIEADPANPRRLLAEGRGYRLVSPGVGMRLN